MNQIGYRPPLLSPVGNLTVASVKLKKEKMILSISVPSAKVPAKKRYLFTPTHLSAGGEGWNCYLGKCQNAGVLPSLSQKEKKKKKQYSLTKTKLRKMFIHSQEIPHNIIKHANNNVHLPKNALFAHKITKQLSSRQKNESSPSQGIAGPTRGHLRQ